MLVLSRKARQKIKIGDNIVVSVLGIEGDSVKIGVDAPGNVTILRMEVFEQIQKENIESAEKEVSDVTDAADLFHKRLSGGKKD